MKDSKHKGSPILKLIHTNTNLPTNKGEWLIADPSLFWKGKWGKRTWTLVLGKGAPCTDLPGMSLTYSQQGRDKEKLCSGVFLSLATVIHEAFLQMIYEGFFFAFKMWNKSAPSPKASSTEIPPSTKPSVEPSMCGSHPTRSRTSKSEAQLCPAGEGPWATPLFVVPGVGLEQEHWRPWNVYQVSDSASAFPALSPFNLTTPPQSTHSYYLFIFLNES